MVVKIGDIIHMKKTHPCGANTFSVLRIGADLRLRCTGCGREMMMDRARAVRNIKKVESNEN